MKNRKHYICVALFHIHSQNAIKMNHLNKFIHILSLFLLTAVFVSCEKNETEQENGGGNQQGTLLWQKSYYETSNYEYLNEIFQTEDGGFIMRGRKVMYSGGADWFPRLTKIDPSGAIVWEKTYNGLASLNDMSQTTDNGYIAGGSQVVDPSFTTSGIVYKVDGGGNLLWEKLIGGDDHDEITSIKQTLDGGYILGAQSYSNISGDKTEDSEGGSDYWIIKLDAAGNIVWQNTIGGSGYDIRPFIFKTNDTGYMVVGSSDSPISGDKTENNRGKYDYWVVKLDVSGNIVWQKTIGGNEDDLVSDVVVLADGSFVIGGTSKSGVSGEKTENSQGGSDYWIIKLDAAGNIVWQNTIGGNKEDIFNTISTTQDNGYILGGASSSDISGDKTETSLGESDFWLIKLSPNGSIEWQNTIGGASYDNLTSVNQNLDESFILGGYSQSGISGDKTVGEAKIVDHYWVISYKNN